MAIFPGSVATSSGNGAMDQQRWVIERSIAWATRVRRLAKDDERLPETVAGLHVPAFACLMLHKLLLPASASP